MPIGTNAIEKDCQASLRFGFLAERARSNQQNKATINAVTPRATKPNRKIEINPIGVSIGMTRLNQRYFRKLRAQPSPGVQSSLLSAMT